MGGQKRAGFRSRGFRRVPPHEHKWRGRHCLRRALQAWHLLRGAQSAILAGAILVQMNENERQAQHQKDG